MTKTLIALSPSFDYDLIIALRTKGFSPVSAWEEITYRLIKDLAIPFHLKGIFLEYIVSQDWEMLSSDCFTPYLAKVKDEVGYFDPIEDALIEYCFSRDNFEDFLYQSVWCACSQNTPAFYQGLGRHDLAGLDRAFKDVIERRFYIDYDREYDIQETLHLKHFPGHRVYLPTSLTTSQLIKQFDDLDKLLKV